EIEQRLPGPRIESHAVMLHDDSLILNHESQLGQRGLRLGREPPRALKRLSHAANGGTALQESRGHPRGHEFPEPIADAIVVEQAQATKLGEPFRGEPQEPRQLTQRVDALWLGHPHPADRLHHSQKCRSIYPRAVSRSGRILVQNRAIHGEQSLKSNGENAITNLPRSWLA